MEVETPLLCQHGVSDPYIDSFECQGRYLQTSPEYAMKRLLAAGSGAIFQICKAFRLEEAGRQHNPEFSLLEWYRPGFDHHALMGEVDELLKQVLGYRESQSLSYRDCFLTHTGIDPHQANRDQLAAYAQQQGVPLHTPENITDMDTWLQLILAHCIEPKLGKKVPCFLYDYPASQAALAKITDTEPPVAKRFEVYYQGVELANGFHELTSAEEQALRFTENNCKRRHQHKPEVPPDSFLIAALTSGLPDSAGVALGLDRLLMLKLGLPDIRSVISFGWESA